MKKFIICSLAIATLVIAYETLNPYPRQIIGSEPVENWTFDNPSDTNGWRARVDTELSYTNGILKINILRGDPAFYLPDVSAKGPFLLEAKIKSKASGEGQFFWTTTISSNENSEKSATVPIFHDGNWHDYVVELSVNGKMMTLRFDPAFWDGKMEIDNLKLTRLIYHPVEIIKVKTGKNFVSAIVTNHNVSRTSQCGKLTRTDSVTFFFNNKKYILPNGKSTVLKKQIKKSKPFEDVTFNFSFDKKNGITTPFNPPLLRWNSIKRVVRVFNSEAKTD